MILTMSLPMRKALLPFFNHHRFWIVLCSGMILWSCGKSPNCFSDDDLLKVAELQDRRRSDSLMNLGGERLEVQRRVLLSFGSIQDTIARNYLESALHLSEYEWVDAAAFSLSQMGDGSRPFLKDKNAANTRYSYLGKFLIGAGIQSSAGNHFEGVPWAYYRYGLNSKVGEAEAFNVRPFLSDSSGYARLGAVNFFARSNALDSIRGAANSIVEKLTTLAKTDSVEIRMTAVLALRKVTTDTVLSFLSTMALKDADYRVRVNAVRALQRFPFEKTKSTLTEALADKHVNVGIAASEVILATITKEHGTEIASLAKTKSYWRIKANLYEAALKVTDHKELSEEVVRVAQQTVSPYGKAAYITALQQSLMQHEFVADQLLTVDTPVVKTAAASAFVELNRRKNFDPKLKPRFLQVYTDAVKQGDVGVIGTIAAALGDPTLNYRELIQDFSLLKEARSKLLSPRDNETIQAIDAAIAYLEKTQAPEVTAPAYNHPIDWTLVKSIPADQQVLIKTSRGDITIRLFVEETPGTVANFVKLTQEGYFNNKLFHRVVPNFVVQTGCPRGDGWGSENYTIRSEFTPRRFTTGSVGMASSGKDTEGTQWFITHSPTPHLEGRYTNFAAVIDGMDVVHQLQVGDRIVEVRLIQRTN